MVLEQISSTFKNSKQFAGAPASTNASGASSTAVNTKADPEILSDRLAGIYQSLGQGNVSTVIEKNSLVVDLEPNIYAPGAFEVSKAARTAIESILEVLRPHFKDISITVIGHSDSALIKNKSRYIQDNFSLSSLRAAHALKVAVSAGFPVDELFATGTAQNLRASRSISIRIQLKGAVK